MDLLSMSPTVSCCTWIIKQGLYLASYQKLYPLGLNVPKAKLQRHSWNPPLAWRWLHVNTFHTLQRFHAYLSLRSHSVHVCISQHLKYILPCGELNMCVWGGSGEGVEEFQKVIQDCSKYLWEEKSLQNSQGRQQEIHRATIPGFETHHELYTLK